MSFYRTFNLLSSNKYISFFLSVYRTVVGFLSIYPDSIRHVLLVTRAQNMSLFATSSTFCLISRSIHKFHLGLPFTLIQLPRILSTQLVFFYIFFTMALIPQLLRTVPLVLQVPSQSYDIVRFGHDSHNFIFCFTKKTSYK